MLLTKLHIRGLRSSAIWRASKAESLLQKGDYFNSTLSKVVANGLINTEFSKTPSLVDRIKKMTEYYTTERLPLQGHMTLIAYEMLEKPENVTDNSMYQAEIIACAMELLQSYFLIMDDIEDGATSRHGKTCWHLLPDVKTLALNDSSIFRSTIHEILKQNFSGPLYTQLLDTFNDVAIGQHLDTLFSTSKDFSLFTQANYDNIVKYKCTYYTMRLPLMLAMILTNRADEESFKLAENLCREVGDLFQMKNDFMDCFDSESESGKSGTDIQEGKCTWLAVKSLERGTPEQRTTFTTCYGSWDQEHVDTIKNLYKDLDLIALYEEEQRIRYKIFMQKVQALPSNATPTPELFLKLLQMAQAGQ
ncbi:PREDICTED: farnesyl pyrophosphate synthase 1-like isoform X2 [Papilio polytes]|uniref:farnesyl pyrophosphate synthase 1-like isoform X2 n=1 Tax=Papilio polytes TaxID=76194 RepID=UPI000675F270|nr:PREDICTED: farnesyl pyrophosphate synthase 1-like isoform X2 [Papilio polytes]